MAGTECTVTAPERYQLSALQSLCLMHTGNFSNKIRVQEEKEPFRKKISLRVTFQINHSFHILKFK